MLLVDVLLLIPVLPVVGTKVCRRSAHSRV